MKSDDTPLDAALERCRAHRAALVRIHPLPPDSLHRLLRCGRCGRWCFDTRVYEGFLQLGDGGRRPCWSLDELLSFMAQQHTALHRVDRLEPCPCGAPVTALEHRAARFFHEMPGSGASLVLEVRYEDDGAPGPVRIGRSVPGGAMVFFEAPSEAGLHQAFGVPVVVWSLWERLVAETEGALATVEDGMALAAFPADATAFRDELTRVLRADVSLRAYGLSPRITADPAWAWLATDPHLAARPDTVLLMLVRHDAMAARIEALAAARGLVCRAEGDTLWLSQGLAQWPVELALVAEEGLRRGFSLSTFAAAAVAHALERLDTLKTFLDAVESLRPGVELSVEGMKLVPSRGGVAGRPFDLTVAPFGAVPDPDTLDRDLRFHLHEAPAWSDAWRVCPCGAARALALHRWRPADLTARGLHPDTLVLAAPLGEDDTVRVYALSCDRHVEYALGPLLAHWRGGVEALEARVEADLPWQRFVLKVARHTDAEGRAAALVEGVDLADATAHPRLLAGLTAAALEASGPATVVTLSRALAVVAAPGVDPALLARLQEAGRLLWTLQHGAPPTPLVGVFESTGTVEPAGDFVRGEKSAEAVAARSADV